MTCSSTNTCANRRDSRNSCRGRWLRSIPARTAACSRVHSSSWRQPAVRRFSWKPDLRPTRRTALSSGPRRASARSRRRPPTAWCRRADRAGTRKRGGRDAARTHRPGRRGVCACRRRSGAGGSRTRRPTRLQECGKALACRIRRRSSRRHHVGLRRGRQPLQAIPRAWLNRTGAGRRAAAADRASYATRRPAPHRDRARAIAAQRERDRGSQPRAGTPRPRDGSFGEACRALPDRRDRSRFTASPRTRRPALPRNGGRRLRIAVRCQAADRRPALAPRASRFARRTPRLAVRGIAIYTGLPRRAERRVRRRGGCLGSGSGRAWRPDPWHLSRSLVRSSSSGPTRPAALVSPIELFGTPFQNPILLAAGTAGFGRELDRVIDLDLLGGIVTKAVTPEPRQGHPALRVAEFRGGMLDAVGLAKPGLERVASHEPPWLSQRLQPGGARIIVYLVGAARHAFA